MNWYTTAINWGSWGLKWGTGIGFWMKLKNYERNQVKEYMYHTGQHISAKCKPYWIWDNVVEPCMVNQFSVIFAAGHGLVKGLISDNQDQEELEEELDGEMQNIINEAQEEIED